MARHQRNRCAKRKSGGTTPFPWLWRVGTIENMDTDKAIRHLCARQYGAVSRAQLAAIGVSRHAILRRVRSGVLTAAGPKALVLSGSPALAARDAMVAVLDAPDGAMLSHRSAAAWWGLPGFDLNGEIEVTIPRRGAPKSTSTARWHYLHPIPDHTQRVLRGIPVTSPGLTLLHLGAVCWPGRVRRAVNNALARKIVTVPELKRTREELRGSGRNGVGVLAEILDELTDDYVPTESGVELRLSDIGKSVGVPLDRQVSVGDDTEWIGRVDFRVRGSTSKLVELLSFTYHAMFLDRLDDQIRFCRLETAGFSVLRIWDIDVWNRPDEVAQALIDFAAELP